MPSYLFMGIDKLVGMFQTRFSATASQTVANTTSETSLLPAGVGQKTIDADWFKVGRTARLIIRGVYSSALIPGTAEYKVKLGGQTIATGSAVALLGSAVDAGFVLTVTMTCRAEGPTGLLAVAGEMRYSNGITTKAFADLNNKVGATIDTTQSLPIDVTAKWGVLSGSNSMTTLTATLELLEQ